MKKRPASKVTVLFRSAGLLRKGMLSAVVFLVLLPVAAAGAAGDAPADMGSPLSIADKAAFLERMKTVYDRIRDFQAAFRETRNVAALKTPLEYQGTLYYQKETLLLLSYTVPVPSVLQVRDGKALIWVADSPVADLTTISATGDLAGQSEIFGWNPQAFEGDIWETEAGYLLVPKVGEKGAPAIRITIDKNTLTMKHLIMESEDGDKTELFLSGMTINAGLPASILDFSLPEGTRINEIQQP